MLQVTPSERISTIDALNHPYFNDVGDYVKEIYLK